MQQIQKSNSNQSRIRFQLASTRLPTPDPTSFVQTDTETGTEAAVSWRDEVSYSLSPGEGIEVKLAMNGGVIAEYEWNANGATLNHDTHGDGNGQSISYEKGRSIPEQTGQLTSAFTGNHGWYRKSRTEDSVVVTLRTRGAYRDMVLPR